MERKMYFTGNNNGPNIEKYIKKNVVNMGKEVRN